MAFRKKRKKRYGRVKRRGSRRMSRFTPMRQRVGRRR